MADNSKCNNCPAKRSQQDGNPTGACNGGSCSACSRQSHCSCPKAALYGRGNLQSYDWLQGINDGRENQLVEVMFKNTRKSYYLNSANLQLHSGDIVVVEGTPGQDVGKVTMTGALVSHQMKRANLRSDFEPKRIYRLATDNDIERFRQAKDREHETMIRSRKIAAELGLKMKIGDVEYQGDGHKAIFYYIADERVDFRKLIRILAETFGIRVEMKQIGARQEAGRIGGIGPCGRPLCCATFMTRFASVGTGSARLQDISMNPQKLAGQCAKLKCCLNFEVDTYVEAQKKLPPKDVVLLTDEKEYHFFKADILKREISYSTTKNQPVELVTIPASRAFEVIALNKRGIRPQQLAEEKETTQPPTEFVELVGQDSLTRFDKGRGNKSRNADEQRSRKQRNGNKRENNKDRQQRQPNQTKPSRKQRQQRSLDVKPESRQPRQQRPDRQQRQPRPQSRHQSGRQNTQQPDMPVSQSAIRMANARKEKKS